MRNTQLGMGHGDGGTRVSTASGAQALNLQEMALHCRFEAALDEFRDFLHQAQIDFSNLPALATDKMVMVLRFDVPANKIAEVPVFVGCGHEYSATGQTFQDSVDCWQSNAFELLL